MHILFWSLLIFTLAKILLPSRITHLNNFEGVTCSSPQFPEDCYCMTMFHRCQTNESGDDTAFRLTTVRRPLVTITTHRRQFSNWLYWMNCCSTVDYCPRSLKIEQFDIYAGAFQAEIYILRNLMSCSSENCLQRAGICLWKWIRCFGCLNVRTLQSFIKMVH